jgi:RES domain-containing protein
MPERPAACCSEKTAATVLIPSGLVELVKAPPLPADAPPTAENSQKWKDWWAKNRDKAILIIPPRASYDWH